MRPDDRQLINLASGVTWERLTPTSDTGTEFLYVVYDVGSESCPEDSLVTHGGREYGYVMSGRLGIRIGFDEHELRSGDSVSFDSSSPHRLWAIGDEPVDGDLVRRRPPERQPGFGLGGRGRPPAVERATRPLESVPARGLRRTARCRAGGTR